MGSYREEVDLDMIRDLWLNKYHNTSTREVFIKYPKESKTPECFGLFPCTQQECDIWEKEAMEVLEKSYKFKRGQIKRMWPWIYIECAPKIKKG